MAGFLQKDASGDTMPEQSWNQIADVASVLQRLDVQLQSKFEKVDMHAEEQKAVSGKVAELIEKFERSAASIPVGLGERTENALGAALQMSLNLRSEVEEIKKFVITANVPALQVEIAGLKNEVRFLKEMSSGSS